MTEIRARGRSATDRVGLETSGRVAILSRYARGIAHLAAFFPDCELAPARKCFSAPTWASWGVRLASQAAEVVARASGRRFLRMEDGFLRSVGLGKANAPPLSIVVDDLGVFYDAGRPSRLEALIPHADATRGAAVRARVVAARLSKYNAQPDRPIDLGPPRRARILVVDQVRGDHSISGALAHDDAFARMAETARRERPAAELLVRPHPDVVAGYRRGHFDAATRAGRFVADAVDTHAILDAVDEVWTVSSQIGFEALLRGIPVVAFGMPFYAGWGLTDDRATSAAADAARARRAARGVSVDQLVAAALVDYARYADPETARPIDVDAAIDRLIAARAAR